MSVPLIYGAVSDKPNVVNPLGIDCVHRDRQLATGVTSRKRTLNISTQPAVWLLDKTVYALLHFNSQNATDL